ncbi:MAG: chromosome segregation protein SMC, partial [Rhodobacteraceae bacterium]
MQFVRLRLQGFKSFVDATEIAIAPGLTGVVGPNGCGKSNLLEAIRWVMGETSAKAMRGDGMEDVIFAGAASRPPRAFAEVAILLDNAARRAPAGFNDADMLEVARRIARDAGSAYRLNGREVRARDVRMLFADAATGAHSPALVRQGRISELVNAKPVARRAILEEAAGVAGLHQRRHEATLKLDAAARNLGRVEEILDGLDARLATLDKQAKQAARYRAIAEALRRAELALLVARWREAAGAAQAAETALTEATRAAAQAEAASLAAARARAEAEAAAPPAREEAMVAAAVRQRLTLEQAALDQKAEAAAEAARAAAQRLAQLRQDAEREAALNRDAAETLARLTEETAEIARAREGHEAAHAALEAAAAAATETLAEAEAAYAEAAAEGARVAAESDAAARRRAETRA